MSKTEQSVRAAVEGLREMGCIVDYLDNVLTVWRYTKTDDEFDNVAPTVRNTVAFFPGRGYRWGTDGIGYLSRKKAGCVEVFRSIDTVAVRKVLEKMFP
jgi:hypothetical protein